MSLNDAFVSIGKVMKKLKVVYRDASILGAHKPSGIATYRESRNDHAEGFKELLEEQLNQRLFPVHRIDADTSGLVLFALDSRAAAGMIRLFKEQKVDKYYMAWCVGEVPRSGTIHKALKKNKTDQMESARTDFERIKLQKISGQTFSLVHVFPFTGRFHQIRRHFDQLGHPLVGDPLYGNPNSWKVFFKSENDVRLMLLAESIDFIHPMTRKPISIKTKPDF
jgi:tRNA pseudouridine65 synthase